MKEKDYIITLDDNKEYALVSTIIYGNKRYVYLIEMDNHDNCIFAEMNGDTIKIIEDQLLLANVIAEFKRVEDENGEKNS